jgi:hypothetical protein
VVPSMGSTEPLAPHVVQVVKKQRGGSQSRLVLCDDGKLYVLKMHPNPQGNNVLANEALGAVLLSGLGFRVPAWRPILINLKSLPFYPELTMESAEGHTLPACGVHFGSEHVSGPQYEVFDLIPESYKIRNAEQVAAINLFDLWANHHDYRQWVYRRIKGEGLYEAICIDNGHLFGGPDWSDEVGVSLKLWSSYFHKALGPECLVMERWLTVFEAHIPRLLQEAIALIPSEWYTGDIYALCARLLQRLQCLRAIAGLGPTREELAVNDFYRLSESWFRFIS